MFNNFITSKHAISPIKIREIVLQIQLSQKLLVIKHLTYYLRFH